MTLPESATLEEPNDARRAMRATGLLRMFNDRGVLESPDIQVATTLGRLAGDADEQVLLAAAVAVRAVRHGSVCVDLDTLPALAPDLPWPDPAGWVDRVRASPLCAEPHPLRFDLGLLYLDRYWREEVQVCADVLDRAAAAPPVVDETRLAAALDRLFPEHTRQRAAALQCVRSRTVVIGGGPGTGKTTTVARILALLADQAGSPLRVALAAPTGKAAARLQEAVQAAAADLGVQDRARLGELTASTLHRLLGARPGTSRLRFHRDNRLPYEVIVVDESSMVSLTLMGRLLAAVRPEARLILVGDPDQLTPVEAGAVLADIVGGLSGPAAADAAGTALPVVILDHSYRFAGAIATLAEAIRAGDGEEAVAILRSGAPEVELVDDAAHPDVRQDVVSAALAQRAAAERGDFGAALALLERHRLLCAHRSGPFGVEQWGRLVERWLAEFRGRAAEGLRYPGRPVLVTSNDRLLKLYNGDVGVTVALGAELRVAFTTVSGVALFAPSRLPEVESVYAMTVHKSQGSQFDRVTLVLPEPGSPLLTRELLYTAVTRAKDFVRIAGTEEAIREAVARPALRASGLRERLSGRVG